MVVRFDYSFHAMAMPYRRSRRCSSWGSVKVVTYPTFFFCLQCSSDSTSNISLFIATVPESVMSWPLVRPSLDDLLRELLDMHLGAAGGWTINKLIAAFSLAKNQNFQNNFRKLSTLVWTLNRWQWGTGESSQLFGEALRWKLRYDSARSAGFP